LRIDGNKLTNVAALTAVAIVRTQVRTTAREVWFGIIIIIEIFTFGAVGARERLLAGHAAENDEKHEQR